MMSAIGVVAVEVGGKLLTKLARAWGRMFVNWATPESWERAEKRGWKMWSECCNVAAKLQNGEPTCTACGKVCSLRLQFASKVAPSGTPPS